MTYVSPTTGDRVGLSHIQPRSVDDLIRRRNRFKTWAEFSAGMFGRSPDFLNALVMGCATNSDYFAQVDPKYAKNIQRYYELVREQDLCLTHALVAPQVNRALHPDEQAGGAVALRVVDENDQGLILSGARILATLAPASDELFVAPTPSRSYSGQANPQAFVFALPVATRGLRFICRESFDIGRSSFDHPLGSRFEEMDSTAVFDRVLVPWERVFLYGDQEYCAALFRKTNAFSNSIHQFITKNFGHGSHRGRRGSNDCAPGSRNHSLLRVALPPVLDACGYHACPPTRPDDSLSRQERRNWCHGLGNQTCAPTTSLSPWRIGSSRWRVPVTYPGPTTMGTPTARLPHKQAAAASSVPNVLRCHRITRASMSTMSHQLAASRGLPQTAPGLAMKAPVASQS